MSTRGVIGFRRGGEDKITCSHHDSYPDYLGRKVLKFCRSKSIKEMKVICDTIVLYDERNADIIEIEEELSDCCKKSSLSCSEGRMKDWHHLVKGVRYDNDECIDYRCCITDGRDFIKNSLFCEYGYIINLDTKKLEFWRGFQKEPDFNNRYGTEPFSGMGLKEKYYPCKLLYEFDLKRISKKSKIVNRMNDLADRSELIKEN